MSSGKRLSELTIEHKNGLLAICKRDISDLVFIKKKTGVIAITQIIQIFQMTNMQKIIVCVYRVALMAIWRVNQRMMQCNRLTKSLPKYQLRIKKIYKEYQILLSRFAIGFTLSTVTRRSLLFTFLRLLIFGYTGRNVNKV